MLHIKTKNIFEFQKIGDKPLTQKDLNVCWGPSLNICLFVLQKRIKRM